MFEEHVYGNIALENGVIGESEADNDDHAISDHLRNAHRRQIKGPGNDVDDGKDHHDHQNAARYPAHAARYGC